MKRMREVLDNLADDDFSNSLPPDSSAVDRTKYELCKKFVTYLNENDLSQTELSRIIGVDHSRINWIVKYKIDKFTIDRLYELWCLIQPNFELKVT